MNPYDQYKVLEEQLSDEDNGKEKKGGVNETWDSR